MSPTTPTEVLRSEHNCILRMLDAAERVAQSLRAGTAVPGQVLNDIVEFLRFFADRFHHGKEEELLFPALEQKGLSASGGPVGVMLMEHEQGRGYIREMAEAAARYQPGDTQAATQWADGAEKYIWLLRAHIEKENNILFVMAERLFNSSEVAQLMLRFEEVQEERLGGETEHKRLHKLLDSVVAQTMAASPAK